ncbi:hypothetical protein D3C78_1997820 [compost metagenome]
MVAMGVVGLAAVLAIVQVVMRVVVRHFQRQGAAGFAFAGAVLNADAMEVMAVGRQAQGMG